MQKLSPCKSLSHFQTCSSSLLARTRAHVCDPTCRVLPSAETHLRACLHGFFFVGDSFAAVFWKHESRILSFPTRIFWNISMRTFPGASLPPPPRAHPGYLTAHSCISCTSAVCIVALLLAAINRDPRSSLHLCLPLQRRRKWPQRGAVYPAFVLREPQCLPCRECLSRRALPGNGGRVGWVWSGWGGMGRRADSPPALLIHQAGQVRMQQS